MHLLLPILHNHLQNMQNLLQRFFSHTKNIAKVESIGLVEDFPTIPITQPIDNNPNEFELLIDGMPMNQAIKDSNPLNISIGIPTQQHIIHDVEIQIDELDIKSKGTQTETPGDKNSLQILKLKVKISKWKNQALDYEEGVVHLWKHKQAIDILREQWAATTYFDKIKWTIGKRRERRFQTIWKRLKLNKRKEKVASSFSIHSQLQRTFTYTCYFFSRTFCIISYQNNRKR